MKISIDLECFRVPICIQQKQNGSIIFITPDANFYLDVEPKEVGIKFFKKLPLYRIVAEKTK